MYVSRDKWLSNGRSCALHHNEESAHEREQKQEQDQGTSNKQKDKNKNKNKNKNKKNGKDKRASHKPEFRHSWMLLVRGREAEKQRNKEAKKESNTESNR